MKEQHSREIEQLRNEVSRRQQEMERTSRENKERYDELQKAVNDYKDKVNRSQIKEGFYYEYKRTCPHCSTSWLYNELRSSVYCAVCRRNF
jgi:uncharacterized coiled-coil DUF342 family protein